MKTITLWKLGSHKHNILPNDVVINKLIKILESVEKAKDGSNIDIVWDSLIDVQKIEINDNDINIVVSDNWKSDLTKRLKSKTNKKLKKGKKRDK